jgi:transcriptional regulator with XRE-family HTH domain
VSPFTPNERLKQIRTRLGISTREVAELSQKIAETEGNPEFHIFYAWLAQVENSDSIPGLHKLYSLSVIYRMNIAELFLIFGVDLRKSHQHQLLSPLPRTISPLSKSPTSTRPRLSPYGSTLASICVTPTCCRAWSSNGGRCLWHSSATLDVRHTMYGYIRLEDYMLFPVLRPGSFVQIDPHVRKIQTRGWRTEYDRPIYFLELRDGYVCSWCDLQGGEVWLIPHPLSPCQVRRLIPGVDAEIIGQVTAAALRLTDFDKSREILEKLNHKL